MYLDLLKHSILFQQAESLEELVTQIDEDERNLLVFSFKPLHEQNIMATAFLLKRNIKIFIPPAMSKDLLFKLELQLDSRHDKRHQVQHRYFNEIVISTCRLFFYEKQTGGYVMLQETYAIKGKN